MAFVMAVFFLAIGLCLLVVIASILSVAVELE
jgi:hypothetical protein